MGQIRKAIVILLSAGTLGGLAYASGDRPEQVVEPVDVDPAAIKYIPLPSGDPRISDFDKVDWLRFLMRPMMNLSSKYITQYSLFGFGLAQSQGLPSDDPGTPENLSPTLNKNWEKYQFLGCSVGTVQGLDGPTPATVFYMGNGVVLSAAHVFAILTPESKILWPDGETSGFLNEEYSFNNSDVAIAKISNPSQVPSAREFLQSGSISLEKKIQAVVIGFPESYGTLGFQKLPAAFSADRDPQKTSPILSQGWRLRKATSIFTIAPLSAARQGDR